MALEVKSDKTVDLEIDGEKVSVRVIEYSAPPLPPEEKAAQDRMIDGWLALGRGKYTTEQLNEAFDRVKNPEHWKMDIDCVVPKDMQDILLKAIPWHCGGGAIDFYPVDDESVRVVATGYWTNGMEG
jgi:hypothetical protein